MLSAELSQLTIGFRVVIWELVGGTEKSAYSKTPIWVSYSTSGHKPKGA